MLDVVACISLVMLFALCGLYVEGCDRLKGRHS